MTKQTKRANIWVAVTVFVVIIILAGCKKEPAEENDIERHRNEITPSESVPNSVREIARPDSKPKTDAKISLSDVIRSARTWGPAYQFWHGKTAPDFTLTDIKGEQHKLSDYRGKNVMLIFWATWCRPCLMEIPHLIELRSTISEDKLAMLAISYITIRPPNTAEMVRNFVKRNKSINYTVFAVDEANMSAPYNRIRGIPCSFFIDSEGKIKLATEGVMRLSDMKAILKAE